MDLLLGQIIRTFLPSLDIIEEGALCDKERVRKAEVSSDLERFTLMEEVKWRQKYGPYD